jgi:hypothetical protein
LTPPEWDVLENLKGDEFNDFAYVNPYYAEDVDMHNDDLKLT